MSSLTSGRTKPEKAQSCRNIYESVITLFSGVNTFML